KNWLQETYFSHPRIDGMFLTTADGQLLGSIPENPGMLLQDQVSKTWLGKAKTGNGVYVSPVHSRPSDNRVATDLVSAVRAPDGQVIGFVGVSVLVERIGRRLSTIDLADQAECQIIDQNGTILFGRNFNPSSGAVSTTDNEVVRKIRSDKTGHVEVHGTIYSSAPVEASSAPAEPTGWLTVVKQPKAVAYAPSNDLFWKMLFLGTWLIFGTAIIAWLAGKFYRRQSEAAARIEREVVFTDKILANMPSGIALVDP